MGAVRYRELIEEDDNNCHCGGECRIGKTSNDEHRESILVATVISLLPRYAILFSTTSMYLSYRLFNSSLHLPSGLIRPAENSFYKHIHGWSISRRIMNFSYVTSLHVMKSLGVEMVGMSHEYGYDCIPEMRVGNYNDVPVVDLRLALPLLLILVGAGLIAH
jgi:hypothetical protein